MSAGKTNPGNFFEDFAVGQVLQHATPRTLTPGDIAVYNSLYGPRFAVQSSDAFARAVGYPRAPVDDLIVFHTVFGKTVADISYAVFCLNKKIQVDFRYGRRSWYRSDLALRSKSRLPHACRSARF